MSVGDLSTFCSLPWSLSSGVCSFPCRGIQGILCFQINSRLFFLLLWRMSLHFDGNFNYSADYFWLYCNFNNINSTYPWTWKVFLYSTVSFNFFHQCFMIFTERYLTTLVKSISRYFIFIWGCYEWNCFPDFFLTSLLLVKRKATMVLYVDFVSCYFWTFLFFQYWGLNPRLCTC
jgi:hypothetical protein